MNSYIKCLILPAIFLLAAFMVNACHNKNSSGEQQQQEKSAGAVTGNEQNVSAAEAPQRTALPKNWPWRGVCIPSAHYVSGDIEYLSSIGVNFIRIQPKSPRRAKRDNLDPVTAFYKELEWIDEVLDECKKYNLTSIIAFNYVVLDPDNPVSDKSAEFWSNRKYIDSTLNMIEIIAKRYKDRGDELSAYEVIGEPAIATGKKAIIPDNLEDFYKSSLQRIRKYDERRYFLVAPGPWGTPNNYNGFNGFNLNDNKIIYGAHFYLPNPYTHQGIKNNPRGLVYPGNINGKQWDKDMMRKNLAALRSFEKEHNALVYIGEFQSIRWAQGANKWVNDLADLLDEAGWSWTYFAYKPDFDFWNPYFEVENPQAKPGQWKLKETGPKAEIWQDMIRRFQKSK